jgi:transposase
MRLVNELKPDDKAICNFRTGNAAALKKAFRELELYGAEVAATDGAKFRADNSRKNNHNKTTVEKELAETDKRINEYLAALERGDKEEQGECGPNAAAVEAALEKLRERKGKYEELKKRVEKEGEASTADALASDARHLMPGFLTKLTCSCIVCTHS